MQSIVFFRSDSERPEGLRAEFARTPFLEKVRSLWQHTEEGVFGRALAGSEAVLVRDTEKHVLPGLFKFEPSLIVAPLLADRGEGALYVGAATPDILDEPERELIETVSNLTALALRRLRAGGDRRG